MESNKEEQITTVSEENIYKLNGRVPLRKAIPFGLQHVLAMFVSNLAPVLIVTVISDRSDRIRTSDYYGSQFYVSWKSVGNCNESESWI